MVLHFTHTLFIKVFAAFLPVFCCAYSFAQYVNPTFPSAVYIPEITKEQQAAKIIKQRQVAAEEQKLREEKFVDPATNENIENQRIINKTEGEMLVLPSPKKSMAKDEKPANANEKKYAPNK